MFFVFLDAIDQIKLIRKVLMKKIEGQLDLLKIERIQKNILVSWSREVSSKKWARKLHPLLSTKFDSGSREK